jgi:sugar/nucleoside kinase (ribokinase family)
MDAAIYGLIVADVIAEPMDLRGGKLPPRGGLALLNSITLATGGNACNVALAMAKLGMSVGSAGLVGDDALGAVMIDRLRAGGVDTSAVRVDPRAQTSATIVAVDETGERSFFHAPGANALLDPDSFRRCFDLFRQCAWLHIGYFGLLPAVTRELPALLVELRAAAPGTKVGLDTSYPPADRELLDPILPHLDLFAPSRPEAIALTDRKTAPYMVAKLRERMPQGLIGIKLDADGCYLNDGKQALHVPAYEIKPIDTTGAGDAWYAGLLTGLRRSMTLEQCGRFANRVAADCCLALGASTGIKSFEDTISRL